MAKNQSLMDLANVAINTTPHPPVVVSPHPDLGGLWFRQHNQHGLHTRAVMPPLSMPYASKRASDHPLLPRKPMKRAHGAHRNQGVQGRGGRESAGGSVAKGDGPTKGKSAVSDEGNISAEKSDTPEGFSYSRWSDDERTILFNYFLGPGSDEVFEGFGANATHAYKKASEVLFEGKYSQDGIKAQFIRAYDSFTSILALERFDEGGRGGDESPANDKDVIEKKIPLARSHGAAVGRLTSKTYFKWKNNGWYDLFDNQFGKCSKAAHSSRNLPLSDAVQSVQSVVGSRSDNEASHSLSQGFEKKAYEMAEKVAEKTAEKVFLEACEIIHRRFDLSNRMMDSLNVTDERRAVVYDDIFQSLCWEMLRY